MLLVSENSLTYQLQQRTEDIQKDVDNKYQFDSAVIEKR